MHSGDVKIYRALDTLHRAYLVGQATLVPDEAEALAALADVDSSRPARWCSLSLKSQAPVSLTRFVRLSRQPPRATSTVNRYEAERIALQVDLPAPGVLVVSNSWYPGWRATVDGQPVPMLRANLLFRAVALPAGVHDVIFEFKPTGGRAGLVIALVAGLVLFALVVVALIRRR